MAWFLKYRTKRAAKKYALKMPAALGKGYGGSDYYTPAQIRATAKRLRLNLKFIALGYAAFLEPEQFASLINDMPIKITYDEGVDWISLFRLDKLPLSAAWHPIGPTPQSLVGFTP